MKKLIAALAIVTASLTLTACAPGWSKSGNDTPKVQEETKTYGVGSTITNEDGVSIRFVGVTSSAGKDYAKPDLDRFLVLDFEIENNSSDEIAVSSLMSFTLTSASGHSFDSSIIFDVENRLDGSVKAGRKLVGQIVYDVNDEDLYYVAFKPNVFGDDMEFQFSPNDFAG